MNRFFRTAYYTTLVYLCLAFFGVLISRTGMPFPAFSCLYFGLLLCLLPGVSRRLSGKEALFYVLGAVTAALGFLPIALWHCPMLHWLIHLFGIAGAAVFLRTLRHRTTHRVFMEEYELTLVLLLVLIGFVCLFILTGVYRDGQAAARSEALRLAIGGAVPYAIILLASGTLLLRGLRAQSGMADEQAFNRRQLRDVLIFAVLVTLVFAVDPFVWLRKALFFLLDKVLRPSARYLVQMLATLLSAVPHREEAPAVTPLPEESADPGTMPVAELADAEAEHFYVSDHDMALAIAYVFIAIAALVLLYVLALQIARLIRNLRERGGNRGSGYPNEICEKIPVKEGTGREGKPRRRSGDARERIRYLYGEYLRCLKKRRVPFGSTNTCGEIRLSAEKRSLADPSELADLTMCYEKARYRLTEKPTAADAEHMEELLDGIRKSP